MSNMTGKTLGRGRYELQERLGQGGMAEVYKAYQPKLDRYVAIKMLHAFVLQENVGRERFQREAKAVAALRHPHIVQIFDFDTVDEDIYFMVMEYIEGPTLAHVLSDREPAGARLGLDAIEEIMTAVGSALGYAHTQGIIHRDIKPHNIMFTRAGQPMLTDFGLARLVTSASLSAPESVAGTPAYMSPEQGRGDVLDRRSDIYSLGVVLYEMLTGRIPFNADTPLGMLMKHINELPALPASLDGNVPLPLERVVMKAMAKAADERYQTAEELVVATRAAVAEIRSQAAALVVPVGGGASPVAPLTIAQIAALPPADAPAAAAPPAARASVPPVVTPAVTPPAPKPAATPAPELMNLTISSPSEDDNLTVRLAIPEVIAESGGPPVENTVLLTNPSQEDETDQYSFELLGLDAQWFKLDRKSVLLMCGDSVQIRIRFTVPRRGSEPGVYMYRLVARSAAYPAVVGVTTGRLRVSSPPVLQMDLTPATATGGIAHYSAHLANGPASGIVVALEGKDPSGTLVFAATPPQMRLRPNEEATVEVAVAVKPGVVGEARPYPFTLAANLTAEDDLAILPIECEAEFVFVPEVTLLMSLDPPQVQGSLGDYQVILTNPTSLTLDVDLRAEDPDQAVDIYFHEETDHLRLGREATATAKAIVRLASGNVPAARRTFPFTLHAHARNVTGPGEIEQVVRGELVYEPPPPPPAPPAPAVAPAPAPAPLPSLAVGFQAQLAPVEPSGTEGTYDIRLINGSGETIQVVLRARDPSGLLAFSLTASRVALAAQTERTVRLTVHPNALEPLSQGHQYPFEAICWVPGTDVMRSVRGELLYISF